MLPACTFKGIENNNPRKRKIEVETFLMA